MPFKPQKRPEVTQPSDPSIRLIPLTQGQNAIVDAADFDWLSRWNWCACFDPTTKSFRALRPHPTVYMHREILGCTEREEGDHRNHDTLDNRRGNLRKCTQAQNNANKRKYAKGSSSYKGVRWHKIGRKWEAYIGASTSHKYLGLFIPEEDAARAYDVAALELYGDFAHLNFPHQATE
jgi:hypothetical protein